MYTFHFGIVSSWTPLTWPIANVVAKSIRSNCVYKIQLQHWNERARLFTRGQVKAYTIRLKVELRFRFRCIYKKCMKSATRRSMLDSYLILLTFDHFNRVEYVRWIYHYFTLMSFVVIIYIFISLGSIRFV